MTEPFVFDRIDLHLIRVLHTVLTEGSVSRAAMRLGMHQPAVSAALRRLRELSGDALLVRSGAGMVPTAVGLRMIEPAASILRDAQTLFSNARSFDPATSTQTLRLSASDYLDPQFLPQLVAGIKAKAPQLNLEIRPLSEDGDYRSHLAEGRVDIVIGNWTSPPEELHLGRLFDDEVVCLVAQHHPMLRRSWSVQDWLAAEHIAPTPAYPGAQGFIDEHLAARGMTRRITVRCPYFGLIPSMVASSLLILTTGRQYCERFLAQLPLKILPAPVDFPRMVYYQLWHDRTHASSAARWLRERVRDVAQSLRPDCKPAQP